MFRAENKHGKKQKRCGWVEVAVLEANPFGFKWPDESIVALGVSFSYNVDLRIQRSFEDKVKAGKTAKPAATKRPNTLIGKIIIVKTLALAKLIYCAWVLPVPKKKT